MPTIGQSAIESIVDAARNPVFLNRETSSYTFVRSSDGVFDTLMKSGIS
jgi:hypothetical protein